MNTAINTTMGRREWAMLITLSMLWGGSFFFVELIVDRLPPLTIVWLRVGVAAVALWIIAALMRLPLPTGSGIWLAFLAMGLINNVVPFSLIVWGQIHIASGLAAILNATTPMFTVIVAGLFLADERPTPAKWFGVVFGFTGVVLMIGPVAFKGIGNNLLAQLAVLGAALSYAFAGVFGRRFKTMGLDPITTAAGQVSASTLVLLPIALIFEWPPGFESLKTTGLAAIIALGLLSTATAYVLYFRLLASAGATNLLLVTFLIPVSAILLGSLILGEVLKPVHFAGIGLIGLGLVVIDGRLLSPKTPPNGNGTRI